MTMVGACQFCKATVEGSPNFCPECGSSIRVGAPRLVPSKAGLSVGGYRLGEKIGDGAVGEIYRASHETLGKEVVIKLLHPHLLGDSNTSRRFRREALAASRLNHPNVIQVLDFGQMPDGRLYLAMEYVEGVDLAELVHRDGQLSTARIIHVIRQVCFALDEAHSHDVLHRDLKPENIMVGDSRNTRDHVKVVDFGIAKVMDPSGVDSSIQTISGIICGTPEYMSPEQARGDELDLRSDLYTLGVILYLLLAGRLPFEDISALGVVTKHLSETATHPTEGDPEASQPLGKLAMRLLSKEPEGRLPDAMAVVQELDQIEGALKSLASDHRITEREASTLSDIPVLGSGHTVPVAVLAHGLRTATQPELSGDGTVRSGQTLTADTERIPAPEDEITGLDPSPGDTVESPAARGLLSDTAEDLKAAARRDGELGPGIDTSPGGPGEGDTQDVLQVVYPKTTPMHPGSLNLPDGKQTRGWLTVALIVLAIGMLGWLSYRILLDPYNPPTVLEAPALRETPP